MLGNSVDTPAASRRPLVIAATGILLVGFIATGLVARGMHLAVRDEANARFGRLTERLVGEASHRINQARYGLAGARGVYASSEAVDRNWFEKYVGSRDLADEFPGALGIGFVQRLMRTDLPAFIAAERADGAPDFAIRSLAAPGSPLDNAPDLYVIKHCFPRERNAKAWGLDIGSEPTRRAAAERAVATGEPAITGRITLVQDIQNRTGFMYFLPVYRNGATPRTPEERAAALVGLAYSPLLLEEALAGVDSSLEGLLDFEIFDGEAMTPDAVLFDLDGHLSPLTGQIDASAFADRMFHHTSTVNMAGRTWTFRTSTTPKFMATVSHSMPLVVGMSGVLLSMLLTTVVWTLGTGRARARALAQSMTADLTAAKARAEDLLREAEALRSTTDTQSIVSVANTRGRIIEINDNFCRISGYSREELIGQDHRIVNSGHHPKAFWEGMWKKIASGQPWRGEVCNKAKDGSLYWVDSIMSPFKSEDGTIEKYVSIRTDITERKVAEGQLAASNAELVAARIAADSANRSKSAFLANMSHEIRTPLTAILGFTELLREDGNIAAAPERRIQYIDTIMNAGTHLLTVINDILDLSKIEADKMTSERIDTPLTAVLHEVESLMRPRASGKGLALSTILSTPVPEHILSDPTRLRQILMNLVGNALKFTEEGGVTITAGVTELNGQSRLVIDIEDTGPGMTQEQAAHLFKAFGQSDETMTRKFGGTGLGLTICRRLSGLMGGDTTLLRAEEGKGSCFRVELPLVAVPGSAMISHLDIVAATSTTASTSSAVKLTGQILFAEDGLDNQRLIAFHLKMGGAQVTIADNGRIALEMIDKAAADGTPYDLLVTDMQMPEMDGYTLARTLRERGSTIPIVALTAHAMAEDKARCIAAGCDDYASKPVDKAKLLAVCAAWMGAPGGIKTTEREA